MKWNMKKSLSLSSLPLSLFIHKFSHPVFRFLMWMRYQKHSRWCCAACSRHYNAPNLIVYFIKRWADFFYIMRQSDDDVKFMCKKKKEKRWKMRRKRVEGELEWNLLFYLAFPPPSCSLAHTTWAQARHHFSSPIGVQWGKVPSCNLLSLWTNDGERENFSFEKIIVLNQVKIFAVWICMELEARARQ